MARRRLPLSTSELLRQHGSSIQIIELQGGLTFTTIEPVVRQASQLAEHTCKHIIFDLRAVLSANSVSLTLLANLGTKLAEHGVTMAFCQPGNLQDTLHDIGIPREHIFTSLDGALEAFEDALLLEVSGISWRPSGTCGPYAVRGWTPTRQLDRVQKHSTKLWPEFRPERDDPEAGRAGFEPAQPWTPNRQSSVSPRSVQNGSTK